MFHVYFTTHGLQIPMKNIVEKKLNEVRAQLRAMPKAFTAPKNTSDRQKLLVAITQQVYNVHLIRCFRHHRV